ncbi:MAG: hypothetical protein P8L78_11390 [Mariniblastus sp.]|nr:hypothetical protein [Mariniblastus sp.]
MDILPKEWLAVGRRSKENTAAIDAIEIAFDWDANVGLTALMN